MEPSTFQSIKLAIVKTVGLSRDALHIYVGLTVFLATAALMRKSLRSMVPWFAVIVVAVACEMLDMRDDFARFGYWRWRASLHDILNTLFWPTVFFLLTRFGIFFGESGTRNCKAEK